MFATILKFFISTASFVLSFLKTSLMAFFVIASSFPAQDAFRNGPALQLFCDRLMPLQHAYLE